MNRFIGVSPIGWTISIFIDVTKIVYFTRATNSIRMVCGLEIQLVEAQMLMVLDRIDKQ
jgi:hypothetical protein